MVAKVDLALSHENADLVRKSFRDIGVKRVWDPDRIVIILDHRVPAESEKTATTHKAIREFVREQGIRNFYDVGRGGICHQVLAENGHVKPGMVVVGTDSTHHHARRFRRFCGGHRRHRDGRRVDRRNALVQGAFGRFASWSRANFGPGSRPRT